MCTAAPPPRIIALGSPVKVVFSDSCYIYSDVHSGISHISGGGVYSPEAVSLKDVPWEFRDDFKENSEEVLRGT